MAHILTMPLRRPAKRLKRPITANHAPTVLDRYSDSSRTCVEKGRINFAWDYFREAQKKRTGPPATGGPVLGAGPFLQGVNPQKRAETTGSRFIAHRSSRYSILVPLPHRVIDDAILTYVDLPVKSGGRVGAQLCMAISQSMKALCIGVEDASHRARAFLAAWL